MKKFFPEVKISQHACPMWVPLVENGEFDSTGADYFIEKDIEILLEKSSDIDTVLLACTHYPLLLHKIKNFLPETTKIISQGPIVAESLRDYLFRHSEIEARCSKTGELDFFTTDFTKDFDKHSKIFFGEKVNSKHADL